MASLGLSFLLILAWTVIGAGVLSLTRRYFGVLRLWLLAPGVGLAVQVMAVCFLNQAGLPVNAFAEPLALILVAAGAAVLAWRRPQFPLRALIPFGIAVLVFVFWAGWPALRLRFHWIAYLNDDYTNYCLSAERFRTDGFFRMPTLAELEGKDYTQYFWFMHVSGMMRFGSEHLLALVGSLTGLNALYIFMPVILALGGAQILSLGALVLHRGRWRRHAQWAAALLAVSPVFIFGAIYQLIAQVGGLALMMTVVALLTASFPSGRRRWLILRHAVPTALVSAALAIFYPEITPFAVLAILAFLGMEAISARKLPGARIVLLNFTLIALILLLRYNLVGYIYTLAHQSGAGSGTPDLRLTLFPFYLIPSGFSVLFGFQALPQAIPDPWGSLFILLGLALFIGATIWAIAAMRRLRPIACLLATEVVMVIYLFQHSNDFGLYKIAMFIQPALWAGLAGLFARRSGWPWRAALAGVIVLLGARTTWYYTAGSTGEVHSGMTEMDHASNYFRRLPPAPAPGSLWVSAIDNVVSVKVIANLYRGHDIQFLSRDFFNVYAFSADSDWPLIWLFPDPGIFHRGRELMAARNKEMLAFDQLWGSRFDVVRDTGNPTAFLTLAPEVSLFNKLNATGAEKGQFMDVIPAESHENLLAFIHSSRGNHYYLGDRHVIAFTQLEEDPYQDGGRMSSIGRFLLFRIEHPTPSVYLRISASKSDMAPEHKLWSPDAVAEGQVNVPLGFRGGGAANRLIGPLTPVWRDGAAYVALDFAETPAPFPIHRTGVAAAYNAWVPLDYRRVVAFARDISALSAEQRDRLVRPRCVKTFPDDIAQATSLEFSGIYEDGWLSPDAEFGLGRSQAGECLRIKGAVPGLTGLSRQTMTIRVAGGPTWKFAADPGPFDWLLPIAQPGVHTDVSIHFSGHDVLPGGDERPVGAKLDLLEISDSRDGRSREPIIWADAARPALPSRGIDTDGWMAQSADLWLPTDSSVSEVTFNLEFPGWAGAPSANSIALAVDDAPAKRYELRPGPNAIVVPLAGGKSARHIRFAADQAVTLPPPDGRSRAARLVSVQNR